MKMHEAIFNAAYQGGLDAAEKWAALQEEPEPSADLVFAAIDAAFPLLLEASRPRLPKAMSKVPKLGTTYFIPILNSGKLFEQYEWHDTREDQLELDNHLCYATRKDAKTVAKAMLALVRP